MDYTQNGKKSGKSQATSPIPPVNIQPNAKNKANEIRDGFYNFKRIWGDILPPPSILESYEEAAPGIVEKFGYILKLEQQHRHKLERKFYRSMARSMLIGQFLSAALAGGLIYAAIALVDRYQSPNVAAFVSVFGFLFLIVINIIGIIVRGKVASYFPEHNVKVENAKSPTMEEIRKNP
jgi:uncharacterized membrane protein